MKIGRMLSLLLLSVISSNAIDAQEMIEAIDNKVIPPSPASAVFKKYMGEQPALATGSVNLTILLYTLQCHGISIPFSLRYNTGGIKVFDDPNPCGFGWALLPGLRITRTILNRPDEMFTYVGDNNSIETDYTLQQPCMSNYGQITQPNSNKNDSQHDIFTISLIDKNYTFILDKNGGNYEFKGIGCAELKISADTALNYINVVDGNGTKYIFGGYYEKAHEKYKTAWMVNKIELPNGENITFEWIRSFHANNPHILAGDCFVNYLSHNAPSGIMPGDITTSYSTGNSAPVNPYGEHQHLKKVVFPGGEINATYADGYSGPMIDKFEIKNTQEIIKTVSFDYGDRLNRDESYLLHGLNISDEGIYSFEYNPQRFVYNNRQDYWGYYNGKAYQGEPSLVPRMKIKCHDGNIFNYLEVGYADRSIDPDMMKANILTAVTYPTGGRTTYEYEPHRFNEPHQIFSQEIDSAYNKPLTEGGGLRVTKITTTSGDANSSPVVKRYVYGENENGLAECVSTPILETFVNRYSTINLDFSDSGYPKPEYTYEAVNINTSSNYMNLDINQTPIWYKEVTEYFDSINSGAQGKVVHKFNDHIGRNNKYSDDNGNVFIIELNRVFAKGPLKTLETVYKKVNGEYKLVSKKGWNYATICKNPQYISAIIYRRIYSTLDNLDAPDFDLNGRAEVEVSVNDYYPTREQLVEPQSDIYEVKKYPINFKSERLTSTWQTFYTDNGAFPSRETYTYIDDSEIVSKKTTMNGGNTEVLSVYYPHTASAQASNMTDYANQSVILAQMTAANLLSKPVLTTLHHNGDSVSAQNIFAYYGNKLYLPRSVMAKRGSGTAVSLGTYDYDAVGNLRSHTSPDGMKETFLWGYSGRYPIAHIQNYIFDEVQTIMGGNLDTYNYPTGNVALDYNLRNTMPAKTPIATYQYKSLLGLQSSIDQTNNSLSYSYDDKNRLEGISSGSRGTLQRFAYNMDDERFAASLSSNSETYDIGTIVNLNCSINNTSGIVAYNWTLTDSTGRVITTANSGAQFSYRINDSGMITATCIAVDEMKQASVTCVKTFMVNPENIGFENVLGDGSESVTATLYCLNPVTIRFRLIPNIANGSCTLTIGNDARKIVAGTGYFYFNKTLSSGTYNVSLDFDNVDSRGNVIVYPVEVTGTKGETVNTGAIHIFR